MNSRLKRTITLFLALIMVFSLCVPAMAEEQEKPIYLCLGDSIAAGAALTRDGSEYDPSYVASLDPYSTNQIKAAQDFDAYMKYANLGFIYEAMPTAYHSLVADALDANLVMGARAAMRTAELRCLLDADEHLYNDYDETHTWYTYWRPNFQSNMIGWSCSNPVCTPELIAHGFDFSRYTASNGNLTKSLCAQYELAPADDNYGIDFTNANKLQKYIDKNDVVYFDIVNENGETKQWNTHMNFYSNAVKDADIISLNFGMNDVFSSALATGLMNNYDKLTELKDGVKVISEIKTLIESGDLSGAFAKLRDAFALLGEAKDFATMFIDEIKTATKTFKENYTWIVNKIYELKPDVTIIGIGVYNMFNYGIASEELKNIDIKALVQPTVDEINKIIRSYSLKYDSYYYADISDTETHTWKLEDAMAVAAGGVHAKENFFVGFMANVHPTLNGHKYIANQVINALPKDVGGYSSSKLLDLFETSFIYKFLDFIFNMLSKGIDGIFNFANSGFTYVNPFTK